MRRRDALIAAATRPQVSAPTLLPCPFCGGGVALRKVTEDDAMYERYAVVCPCTARGPKDFSQDKAIAAWNRRSAPQGDALRIVDEMLRPPLVFADDDATEVAEWFIARARLLRTALTAQREG